MDEQTELRKAAIEWWNKLTDNEKLIYWAEYCVNIYSPSLRPQDLTGREIQNIWAVKTN